MIEPKQPSVAIIDYGMGNLYSVQLACAFVGLDAEITNDPEKVVAASGVILPGVGAFGTAMAELRRLGLDLAVIAAVESGKPVLGVCLGLQLLMVESLEFGRHRGLGVVGGSVVRFDAPRGVRGLLKIPQVGWETIRPVRPSGWNNTLLRGLDGEPFMYFVHSYHVVVDRADAVVAVSRYGNVEYCSALQHGRVFACQFHPERSGPDGLVVYRNFADTVRASAGAAPQHMESTWPTSNT